MADESGAQWDGLRSTFAPRPELPDPKRAEELRKAVDEAAGQARGQTFLFLSATLYIAILSATTTHYMLLVGGTIQMPILNIGASITVAYTIAPVLYVVLHLWLLRGLLAASRRIDDFEAALATLDEPARGHQRALVSAFFFVEWRAGRRYGRGDRFLALAINWLVYVAFPVVLLLWVQLRFLPYQHEIITPIHVACVVVDLVLLWWTWPEINGPGRSLTARLVGGLGSAGAGLAALLLWYDQHHDYLVWTDRLLPARVAGTFDYRFSRLVVTDRILMKREPAAEIVAQFRREAGTGNEEEGERRAYLDKELAEPLGLSGRNLRRASFERSKLWGANFEKADLRGAYLILAQLEHAGLNEAQLQDAKLLWAELQGADLRGAQLQGAYLPSAQFQGADLFRVEFQGADLGGAQLQGADLAWARLQGADLGGAQLQGTDLHMAQLQGSDLRGAALYLTTMDERTNLSRVDLRGAAANALSTEAQARLVAEVEQAISEPKTRARVLARLEPLLSEPAAVWAPEPLRKERRRDVIASEDMPDPVRRLTADEALRSPRDSAAYDKALADELAQLVCGAGDGWTARGMLRRMRDYEERKRPYAPNLAGRLLTGCPDLVAKLDVGDRRFLADTAAVAMP